MVKTKTFTITNFKSLIEICKDILDEANELDQFDLIMPFIEEIRMYYHIGILSRNNEYLKLHLKKGYFLKVEILRGY